MSMSTHVVGLRDPNDPKHKAKVAAAEALFDAGIEKLPPELAEYFGTDYASDARRNPDAPLTVKLADALTKPQSEYSDRFDVDIRKLPDGVCVIRFENSY